MTQKILLIKKKFLSRELAKESLDMAIAGSSLDLAISLLLMNDAIFHLVKCHSKVSEPSIFEALSFCDIQKIYIVEESLQERNLSVDDLVMPVVNIKLSAIIDIMSAYDKVY